MPNIIGAALIMFGLAIGGFLAGGRYEIIHTQGNELARLDRFTGKVEMCINGSGPAACGFRFEE